MEAMVLINTAAEEFPRSLFFAAFINTEIGFVVSARKGRRKKGGSGRKEGAEEERKRKKRGSGRKEEAEEKRKIGR